MRAVFVAWIPGVATGFAMLINSLHLKNILSFKDATLDLLPLNVLIGANGSGKSNLIDVIALLRAVPNDIAGFLRSNGPTGDWIWNGPGRPENDFQVATVKAMIDAGGLPLNYALRISVANDRVHSLTENLNHIEPDHDKTDLTRPVLQASNGKGRLWPVQAHSIVSTRDDEPMQFDVPIGKSVLSEIRDPLAYPALTNTALNLASMRLYRSWYVGRDSSVRRPQPTDGPVDFLEEDFSNLALVVNDLRERQGLGPTMDEYLERFYESYKSLHTPIYGNTVSLAVREAGLPRHLPATRLSDGTIRFISLLSILCHPKPPPLICIEEPEIAMHPDSLWLVAELMRKASERTQLIVTTHSPELVSIFSAEPDCVVVCERDPAEGTKFRRVSLEELRDWQDIYQQTGKELVVYGLSEMWMSGSIGGVR